MTDRDPRDYPTVTFREPVDAGYAVAVQRLVDHAYDEHRQQIEAAISATIRARPFIGGLAEFILPPDRLVLYRVQQIFEAAGVEYDD